jgi:hypothetical protein
MINSSVNVATAAYVQTGVIRALVTIDATVSVWAGCTDFSQKQFAQTQSLQCYFQTFTKIATVPIVIRKCRLH